MTNPRDPESGGDRAERKHDRQAAEVVVWGSGHSPTHARNESNARDRECDARLGVAQPCATRVAHRTKVARCNAGREPQGKCRYDAAMESRTAVTHRASLSSRGHRLRGDRESAKPLALGAFA